MLPFCGTITTCGVSPEVLFKNRFSVKNLFCISFSATSCKALEAVDIIIWYMMYRMNHRS